ncbi:CAP domain-containing protein [Mucilaginibacter sp. X4EP1]|uniref:CAP domain-containing protein n=1 Tax=Mucilaginibacter sp. X4EP1 TaxID=2723092 RepID=UPI00216894F4|nr:CAP domain-containing protein [Mucilaginibacter sp. X4EP1]MCS3814953.1 uncharacterized protein YkwD [Mucilaginibacter sp. X4EP1]
MKILLRSLFTITILANCLCAFSQRYISKQDFKREFLEDINHIRAKGCNCGTNYMPPASPVVWNDNLEIAAKGHAYDMAEENYFSHTSKDGRNLEDRVVQAGYYFKGYRSFAVGENIAMGQQSIAEVMQGWIKSEGHCKNLMNPAFKEVGIALYNNYWVQDFGGRQPFTAEQQKLIKSGQYRIIENN